MIAHRSAICLPLMSVMLSGCLVIPIPVNQEDPYTFVKSNLLSGKTTKEQIVVMLGKPAATYMQGQQWVYTASEIEWEILMISASAGGSGSDRVGKQHFLILQFDEQDVVNDHQFEIADPNPGACTPNLYCHDGSGGVFRLADQVTESKAKEFPVTSNQCGIYFYGNGGRPNKGEYTVFLNNDKMGLGFYSLPRFYFWNVSPGAYKIAVYPRPTTKTFNCEKNELIFLRFPSGTWSVKISIVDESKGRKTIKHKNMRLIYPESGPH